MSYQGALGVWLVMFVVAFAFGALREKALAPIMGDLPARAVMTAAVALAFFGVIYVYVGRIGPANPGELLVLGVFWTGLTVGFEFAFGRFVMGRSFRELLADYNILKGRLWPLVLLVTLLGPIVAARLRF